MLAITNLVTEFASIKALDSISFQAKPGLITTVIGANGAGKSTLLRTISGLERPSSGSITWFDEELTHKSVEAIVRSGISQVPEGHAVISQLSVAENISYGCLNADSEMIVAAARRAQAHDFIMSLPQGYETLLGERGITLSGGQRQRLAIARAILADAPVLLLDEATSALDAENESQVQQALRDVMSGRTSIVIAHRLATVLEADRIIVLENGVIVEEGTHMSLSASNGLYSRLAKLQFDTGRAALVE